MSTPPIPNTFFSYGIATGVLIAISGYMFLFSLFKVFWHKKHHDGWIFFYGAIGVVSYMLFSLYTLHTHSSLFDDLIPSWILLLGKLSMPVGLYMNTKMFLGSIPTKSLKAFVFWDDTKHIYQLINLLYWVTFVALLFIDNDKSVMLISMFLAMLATSIGANFSYKSLENTHFRTLYCGVLCIMSIILMGLFFVFMLIDIAQLQHFESILLSIHMFMCMMILLSTFVLIGNAMENMQGMNDVDLIFEDFAKSIFNAIKNDEFYLEYQPKVDLKQSEVCGVEALIRWHHPKKGIVAPTDFIPVAEQSHIINNICKWVIDKALSDIQILMRAGMNVPVALNFSVRNISLDMVDFLRQCIEKYDLPSYMIIIEITESLFLHLDDEQKLAMDRMREMGVKLSLDDFSAGFSSLKYLDEMGLYELKIDKELTSKVADVKKRTVVTMIIGMCRELGIRVVAEGVDDDDISNTLKDIHCEVAQGYGICRPKILIELMDWFKDKEKGLAIQHGW